MKIDVSYVAELARLELTEEEKATFQPQLESIVEYVDKISSVDVEGVPPMMHGRELVIHDGRIFVAALTKIFRVIHFARYFRER